MKMIEVKILNFKFNPFFLKICTEGHDNEIMEWKGAATTIRRADENN